jgi:uncharacterized protein (UPF0276 family)
VSDFVAPPRLGVGFTYQRGLHSVLETCRELIDFYEISPDLLCTEHVVNDRGILDYQPQLLEEALAWCADRPLVVHGLGLSIGSASGWNEAYLRILDSFHQRRRFAWHSEHLGFMLTARPDGTPLHTGVPLPLPFTEESLDLLVPRARALSERYEVPFLLENLTYYLPDLLSDGGRDEVAFLNDLTERSGCGLLLDLYNFHCNAVNFGFDARQALDRLRLDRVVEVHLAGGVTHDGFLVDVHSDIIPEPVWDLVDWLAPHLSHLSGITYELLEQALPIVGVERIGRQLERARQAWHRCGGAIGQGVGNVAG